MNLKNPRQFEIKDERTLEFEKPTTVFICDPCYIFDYAYRHMDSEWQSFVDKMYEDESKGLQRAGILEIAGARLLYTSTAYGDGVYSVQSSFEVHKADDIGVDAGMICVISMEDALKINPKFKGDLGATIMGFQGSVTATGKGFIGDLVVDTEDEDDN